MADAGQYRKIQDILLANPDRRVVIVSAAGKRFPQDHKITDLLYLCYAHTQYGVDCSGIFDMIASRYLDIRDELGLDLALEPELEALKKRIGSLTGTKVQMACSTNGKGKITIPFASEEELGRIIELFDKVQ